MWDGLTIYTQQRIFWNNNSLVFRFSDLIFLFTASHVILECKQVETKLITSFVRGRNGFSL